jgi:tight adherence protein B
MEKLIVLGVFLLTLFMIYGGYLFVKIIYKPEQRKALQRLRFHRSRNDAIAIEKKRTLSEIPWLNEILLKASFIPRLERLHAQSAVSRPLGVYVTLSVFLFFSGLFLAMLTKRSPIAAAFPSALLATAPLFYLVHKKKIRFEKFERQLPEALELVSRALKAGHAFTAGLRMVAEEMGDPVGVEFGKTVDEINFGMAIPDALTNLTQRVDCEDLRFFAVSVIVQRETGGNLSEILENLSRLIRERFKFQGRVRILSAEGRMSAKALIAMPFIFVGLISVLNPDYISVLFTDSLGHLFIMIALAMMAIGALVIKKIVAIKV